MTVTACHFLPVGVAILRSFSAVAIARADRSVSSVLLGAFHRLVAVRNAPSNAGAIPEDIDLAFMRGELDAQRRPFSNGMVPLKDGRCHWRSIVEHHVLAKRTETGRYDRAVLRRVQKDVSRYLG